MNFSLATINEEDLNQYKADMQQAFQKGFEEVFGKTEDIIFYVNKCGFHIVEFLNEKNPGADMPEDFIGDGGEGMFVFRKQM